MCHGMQDSRRHSDGLQGDLEQISNGILIDLVLIGLLYKAYPNVCQHRLQVLLRLRPYPVWGHRLLSTARAYASVIML